MRAKTLAATSTAVTGTAVVGGLGGRADTRWFRRLRKPPFQPAPLGFPIVWTALYAAIAAGSAETIEALDDKERTEFEVALAANLILNAGWTWCFFRLQRPWLATAESAVLALSSADLARRSRTRCRTGFALLAPYAAWTAFATILSGSIAWLNRGRRTRF